MTPRIRQMASKCKNRGGDCTCIGECQAKIEVAKLLVHADAIEREARQKRESLQKAIQRLETPLATLHPEAFKECPEGWEPVMVFDGGEAHFGFENPTNQDDWIDAPWPFNESSKFAWHDDCTRNGIRVELA